MNFESQLNAELSKANTEYVAHVIGDSQELFDQIYNLMISSDLQTQRRAAWVVDKCCTKYPFLIKKHIPEIIEKYKIFKHPGLRRSASKILSLVIIPEEYLGKLLDICFKSLLNNNETVAVKMHCMQIIYNAIPKFPELKNEFIAIIEDQIPKSSAGFKSRGLKLLKNI